MLRFNRILLITLSFLIISGCGGSDGTEGGSGNLGNGTDPMIDLRNEIAPEISISPRYPLNSLDIIFSNIPSDTRYTYSITDQNSNTVNGSGMQLTPRLLLPNIDIASLADGTLTISMSFNETINAGFSMIKDAVRDQSIAVILFKETGSTTGLTTTSISSRFADNGSNNARTLLESASLNQESVGTIDSFGPYFLSAENISTITATRVGPDYWMTNADVILAVQTNQFIPQNYDIIYAVYESTDTGGLMGNTGAAKEPVNIAGTSYGETAVIGIYGSTSSLLTDQCFGHQVLFTQSDECISSNNGFFNIDSVLVHEYIHTKGNAIHPALLSCNSPTSPIGDICVNHSFNFYDLMGSSRIFSNILNPLNRNMSGWFDSSSTRIIKATPPNEATQTYSVTLYPENSTLGHNSIRIDFQGYWASDLWIQNIAASTINYSLRHSSFTNSVNGLLVYQGNMLLDASPASVQFSTGTNTPVRYNPIIGMYEHSFPDQLNIALTSDGYIAEALGVYVENLVRHTDDERISFDLRLSPIIPTRKIPVRITSRLPCADGCQIVRGSSVTNSYSFLPYDIGFPDSTNSWSVEYQNLPEGIEASNSSIATMDDNGGFSATPFSRITYAASSTVATGISTITIRVCNSNDQNVCQDLNQVLDIR